MVQTEPAGVYDICCIGHITLDHVVTPQSDVYMPGGTAYYFSHAIAAMDVAYLLVTAVASSEVAAVTRLEERGIQVKRLPSKHTVFFENRYEENQDQRTQKVLQVADPFPLEAFHNLHAKIFHLGPLLSDDIPPGLIRELGAKGKVSLDVQGFLRKVERDAVLPIDWADKQSLLPSIHFLKVNEEELNVLTGCTEVEPGAKTLAAWGVKEVVITLGSRGSVIYSNGFFYSIPAFAPACITDATGCGDTYMAGYLSQRVRGVPIQKAGAFAAAMASLKISASGPFMGGREEVERAVNAT